MSKDKYLVGAAHRTTRNLGLPESSAILDSVIEADEFSGITGMSVRAVFATGEIVRRFRSPSTIKKNRNGNGFHPRDRS